MNNIDKLYLQIDSVINNLKNYMASHHRERARIIKFSEDNNSVISTEDLTVISLEGLSAKIVNFIKKLLQLVADFIKAVADYLFGLGTNVKNSIKEIDRLRAILRSITTHEFTSVGDITLITPIWYNSNKREFNLGSYFDLVEEFKTEVTTVSAKMVTKANEDYDSYMSSILPVIKERPDNTFVNEIYNDLLAIRNIINANNVDKKGGLVVYSTDWRLGGGRFNLYTPEVKTVEDLYSSYNSFKIEYELHPGISIQPEMTVKNLNAEQCEILSDKLKAIANSSQVTIANFDKLNKINANFKAVVEKNLDKLPDNYTEQDQQAFVAQVTMMSNNLKMVTSYLKKEMETSERVLTTGIAFIRESLKYYKVYK